MKELRSDRLWPVLLVTVVLLGGAAWIEVAVSPRHVEQISYVIAGAPADLSEDAEGSDAPEGAALDAQHESARVAARRGDLPLALDLFRTAVAAHPDAGRLRAELGYWLLASDQSVAALATLETAGAQAPEDAWVALTLGRARSRADDLAGAEQAYRSALANRPGYGTARVSLGSVLRREGRLDEAIEVLERASGSGGNEDRARAGAVLGRTYLAAGRETDARAAFERAIQLAPASVEIRLLIARAWMSEGGPDPLAVAQAVLDEAALLAPDVPQVQSALGRVAELQQDLAAAEDHYAEALRLDPTYVYPRRRLLRLALDADDAPRAALQVARLLDEHPDDPENRLLAGLVSVRVGDLEEGRLHYRHALQITEDDYPEAWFNLGLLERKAGNLDAAIASYREALVRRPDYHAARNNLALTLRAADRSDEAEAVWRDLVARDPGYAGAWQNLGDLLRRQERFDEAIPCYQRALEAEPGHTKARLHLGIALADAGRLDEAVATYRTLVARDPRYVTAWYNLGLACKAAEDLHCARAALARAVVLDPSHRPAARSLASLDRKERRYADAAALYEDLLDRDPADTAVRLLFARVLRSMGDRQGCVREARAVAASDAERRRSAQRLVDACTPSTEKEESP